MCGSLISVPDFMSKPVVLNSKMMSIRKRRSTMESEHLMKSLSMKPGFGWKKSCSGISAAL